MVVGLVAAAAVGYPVWTATTSGPCAADRTTIEDAKAILAKYRIRFDGSRIEHHTWGQVNPFGMAFDEFGNMYSSDCHSAPTYQLLAGGYYPSFGKPHDGLGFAPVLMEHSHGSTAIDAMCYYTDDLWPAEFKDNIFVGNVMTSRMNRDRLQFSGSSPRAIELDDFVKTTDPWFRPVQARTGPDGALWIVDMYRHVIEHPRWIPPEQLAKVDLRAGRVGQPLVASEPVVAPGGVPHGHPAGQGGSAASSDHVAGSPHRGPLDRGNAEVRPAAVGDLGGSVHHRVGAGLRVVKGHEPDGVDVSRLEPKGAEREAGAVGLADCAQAEEPPRLAATTTA